MNSLRRPEKILLALFFCAVFLYSFNQIGNSDTFYHVKSGEYIVSHFTVPVKDIFSLPAQGAEWIPHEWLAQVIFYLVYAASGLWGLIAFSALLGAATYWILWRLAIRKGADFYLSLLFLFITSYLTLELWVPRPQILAYLSFALLIYFLERWREDKRAKYLIWTVLVIWFWANVNASFVLGLAVIGFYCASEAIGARARGWSPARLSSGDLRNLCAAALAAAALSVFAAPAGYRGLFYSFYIREVATYLSVLEWKPITVYLYEVQAQLFVAILALADAFFAWWFAFREESRDQTLAGLVWGVSLLPFIAIRHVGFWPIAAFFPAAASLSILLKRFRARIPDRAARAFLFALGVVFVASRLFWIPKSAVDARIIPVHAADFVAGNNLRGPLFNLYNEGGYLIFRLWPEDKVFIDGRSEVYRGRPIIEFFTIFGLHPGWETLADEQYRLNYFFLDSYSHPAVRKFVEPLTQALLKKHFRLVYWDDLTIILVRDAPENKALIDQYGLRYVNPFIDPSEIPTKDNKAAAAEIQSLLERFPDSAAIRDYADWFLGTHSNSRLTH